MQPIKPTGTQSIVISPYNSRTGEGTLSGYARQYGTTVQELQRLNPNITNPNVIQAGARLNVPTFTPPTVISSAPVRNEYNQAVNQLNTITSAQPRLQNQGDIQQQIVGDMRNGFSDDQLAQKYGPDMRGFISSVRTTNQQSNLPRVTGTQQGITPGVSSALGLGSQYQPANIDLSPLSEAIRAEASAAIDRLNTVTQQRLTASNDANRELTEQVRANITKRVAELERLNQEQLAANRVAGIAAGRDRYASTYQDNFLSDIERSGIQKVADLENEGMRLIEQAIAAKTEKQANIVMESVQALNDIRAKQNQELRALLANQADLERVALDKSKESRLAVKENISNLTNIADSIAGSVLSEITDNNLSGKDLETYYDRLSAEYEIPKEFLKSSVSELRKQNVKNLPASVQEYEYYKSTSGYNGTLVDFMRLKKEAENTARRVTSGSGKTITPTESKTTGIPAGKTEAEIINELNSPVPPDWFVIFNRNEGLSDPQIKTAWTTMLEQPEIQVFKNTGSGLVYRAGGPYDFGLGQQVSGLPSPTATGTAAPRTTAPTQTVNNISAFSNVPK